MATPEVFHRVVEIKLIQRLQVFSFPHVVDEVGSSVVNPDKRHIYKEIFTQ